MLRGSRKISSLNLFFPELDNHADIEKHLEPYMSLLESGDYRLEKEWLPFDAEIDGYLVACLDHYDINILFPGIVFGFVRSFFSEVLAETNKRTIVCDKKAVTLSVCASLIGRIFPLVSRIAVEDFNLYCDKHSLINVGYSDKYKSYNEMYIEGTKAIEHLYGHYPELFSTIKCLVKDAKEYYFEILSHIEDNYDLICQIFFNGAKEKLKKIGFNAGDSHNHGKSVIFLKFDEHQLVYKPRALSSEKTLNELFALLSSYSKKVYLPQIKLVDFKDFGVMEYLEERKYSSIKEQVAYYNNLGKLLAILYCVNATDCHFENIVSVGEYPFLVDAETVFYPGQYRSSAQKQTLEKDGVGAALESLEFDISGIGILPSKFVVAGKPLDLSHISVSKTEQSPISIPMIECDDANGLRVVYRHPLVRNNSAIQVGGSENLKLLVDSLVEGFSLGYELILSNKGKIKRAIQANMLNAKIRYVPKPSMVYSNFLSTMTHPAILAQKESKLAFLSRIGFGSTLNLSKAEIRDLWRCDIPYFYVDYSSNKFRANDGKVIDFLSSSPQKRIEKKFTSLSRFDLCRQIESIYASFYRVEVENNTTNFIWEEYPEKSSEVEPLKMAEDLLEYLSSVRSFAGIDARGRSVRYFCGSIVPKTKDDIWNNGILNMDLYDGNPGIALTFAYASKKLNNPKWYEIALECVRPLSLDTFSIDKTGFYDGFGGWIYVLTKLFQIEPNEEIAEIHCDLIKRCRNYIASNDALDFLSDNIGLAFSLCSILQGDSPVPNREKIESLFFLVCNAILAKYRDHDNAITQIRYSGFIHGMASIMSCVYRLYSYTNNSELYEVFINLLRYDRGVFKTPDSKWIDGLDRHRTSRGLCHGSPGVLMGRLLLASCGYKDELLDSEIESLICEVKNHCFGNGLSYCHGDFGNLAILKYSSEILNTHSLYTSCIGNELNLFASNISNFINSNNESMSRKYSGLMIGMAGVVYELLSFDDPNANKWFLAL